jgi:protease IV
MAEKPVRWRRRVLIGVLLVVVVGAVGRLWSGRHAVQEGSWVLLDLEGNYGEDVPDDSLARLFGEPHLSLLDLLLLIRDAGDDPRVAGMVVRIRPLSFGWAKAQDIRQALLHFRDSGKPLHAYLELELSGGTMEYYVASAAGHIHVPPGAAAPVTGLLAQFVFLGGLWEKLDIDMQVLKIREYKTFGDMLQNKEMSPYHREMANSLLDSVYGQLVDGIAEQRELEPATVRKAIDSGPATPDELRAAGFVDDAEYLDELRTSLVGEEGKFLDADDYAAHRRPLPSQPAVHHRFAVVYGVGPVTTGESRSSPVDGETNMGSDTLVEAFQDAAKDDAIEAIVFRIDSPGGSALASDLIWRASRAAGETKPVVVSMSDVAASGGYYVAAGANRILAQPGTITGSIGVVLAKPNIKGLLAKLGINTAELQRGELAAMMSLTESFGPAELRRINATMDYVYDQFLDRVATGRKLEKDQVNTIGRGRVWTGAQAVENGLVDELGGFFAAINAAKTAVGVPTDEKVELVFYPRRRNLLQRIGQLLRTRVFGAAPQWWQQVREAATAWQFPSGSILALMPEDVSIR